MTEENYTPQVEEDLKFVRSVVIGRHHDLERMPIFTTILWISYFLIGFGWLEFAPSLAATLFISIAAPVFAFIDWLVTKRQQEKKGSGISVFERMMAHHLLTFFVAFACFVSMGFAGELSGAALLKVLLILSGVTYMTFGITTQSTPLKCAAALVFVWAMIFQYIGVWPFMISGILLALGITVIQIPVAREDV